MASRGGGEATRELVAELRDARERAHEAWPDVRLEDDRFAQELGVRVPADAEPVRALRALRAEDCYLAVACATGDTAALAAFERHFVPVLRSTLGRMGFTTSESDETLQVMREELFVPQAGEAARILNYGGRGHLRGWLRAVAARTALRVVRRPVGQSPLRDSIATTSRDPELECLKRTYGSAFREALGQALSELSTEDRLLLKRRFAFSLSCEEIGELYGIHRSTAARRVSDARGRLVEALRCAITRKLNVGRAEFSSLLLLLRSELHLSLSSVDVPSPVALAGGEAREESARKVQ